MIPSGIIDNSVFGSRTYILSDSDSDYVSLIDCGDVDKILREVGAKRVTNILLTHTHFDHIYGLPELLNFFPDALVVTNEWGKKALADDKLNLSRYFGLPIFVDGANVKVAKEGDELFGLTVYETPGHSPSCLCFVSEDCVFSGDACIPGLPVVTNLPGCDKLLAAKSQNRIMELAKGRLIYPGHPNGTVC